MSPEHHEGEHDRDPDHGSAAPVEAAADEGHEQEANPGAGADAPPGSRVTWRRTAAQTRERVEDLLPLESAVRFTRLARIPLLRHGWIGPQPYRLRGRD